MNRRDLIALFAGAPVSLVNVSSMAQAAAELPVEQLFKKQSFRGAVLSPNQQFMAALAPANGRTNAMIYSIETRKALRLTNLSGSDVNSIFWANDKRVIFTTGDQQGVEFRGDGGLFAVDVDGTNPMTLVKPFLTGSSVSQVPRVTDRKSVV